MCNSFLSNMIELLYIFPGIYFCFNKYKYLVDSGTSQDIVWKFTINLTNYTQSKDTWMVIGEGLKHIPDDTLFYRFTSQSWEGVYRYYNCQLDMASFFLSMIICFL